ncbi:DUF1275 domain-containing protein [Terrimonas sp. NA20]|uniref:DUF1275 domain-containing protein n=1 Tax=Terrimonas ginsenosidimutans TaxID=2908004 RepID=A0ABS9KKJ2_9BACT|nr:YoaK family protein [Terrimonas ginsenosidimutans]MCG2612831.1 DUF1275 domain-containing protein [Terrimonas ginsenosidimutans]
MNESKVIEPPAAKHVLWTSITLSFAAGFADSTTFIAGNETFSAHVTGNFIIFGAKLVGQQADQHTWMSLLTFPVFVMAVMTGGWWVSSGRTSRSLLLLESLLLLLAGVTACVFTIWTGPHSNMNVIVVMIAVTAMGFQNAFSRLAPALTFGQTTVMTGNVTQAALAIREYLAQRSNMTAAAKIKEQAVLVGGFASGCVAGASLSGWLGLAALVLPGLIMSMCYLLHDQPDHLSSRSIFNKTTK